MIEVFDAKRTRSYGCFARFKAATVDIVETGSTLKENGLVVLEEVCPLSAWRRIAAACYNGNMKRCLSVGNGVCRNLRKGGCRKRDLPVGDVGGNGARSTLRRS
mgnify:CR=1 FL=1